MVLENKQKKKIQTNQLHWPLNDPYPSQHTVGNPQTQILLWGFCLFLGPTKPRNHNFYGSKLKFYSGGIVLLGSLPKSNFTPGAFAHLGAHWGLLEFRGPKSNVTFEKFVLLGRLPNSNFTPGAFAHFGGPLGYFGVQGCLKFRRILSFFFCLFSVTIHRTFCTIKAFLQGSAIDS
jgi:hypothetical protein